MFVVVVAVLATAVARSGADDYVPKSSYRKTSARMAGEEHAPWRVMRGGSSPDEVEPRELPALPELRAAAGSGDAAALSDLAAGLVAEAERGDRPGSALEAVAVAGRAIDEDPQLAAAHFNLALALEQLGLEAEARAAFDEAARLDTSVDWANEARSRASDLRRDSRETDRDRTALAAGRLEDALQRFEAEREPGAMFGELADTVRAYLVTKALSRRDREAAFRYAGESASLHDLQRALASDAAILRYSAASATEAVVFVIRSDSVEVQTLNVGASAGTIDRMRRADDAGFGGLATAVHDIAFAPLARKLDGITTIAIVPNRDLDGIPFGALFDSARGEYLAERFTIVHASTAGAAVDASRRARDLRDTSLLAIGASRFDYSEAEPLPSVDREALDVAAHSRCARVFSGPDATPEVIERELAESAIIHYAGHIVGRGADARMLLAPSRGRDSLSAKEVAAFRLKKPRVAVLAACRGASIGSSMADAFLEAGVPTVIASAYNLDDAEAPATMRRLHALLANGADAAEALRQTTIHELRAGRGVPVSIRFHATGGASSLIR